MRSCPCTPNLSAEKRPGLCHSIPTGYAINLSCDVTAFLRREQHIDWCYLNGLSWSSKGNFFAELGELFRRLAGRLNGGPERSWSDRVDTDALIDELFCHSLGKGHDRGFRHSVINNAPTRLIGLNRSCIDD